MQLHDVLDTNFLTVSANDYAAAALTLMDQQETSHAFVLERDEVVGVVYRHDLEAQSAATLRDRDVREYMATNLVVVEPELPVDAALDLMRRGGLCCLVVASDKRILGAVTLDGLSGLDKRMASGKSAKG